MTPAREGHAARERARGVPRRTRPLKNRTDLKWLERTAVRVSVGVYVALLVLGLLALLLRGQPVRGSIDAAQECPPPLR